MRKPHVAGMDRGMADARSHFPAFTLLVSRMGDPRESTPSRHSPLRPHAPNTLHGPLRDWGLVCTGWLPVHYKCEHEQPLAVLAWAVSVPTYSGCAHGTASARSPSARSPWLASRALSMRLGDMRRRLPRCLARLRIRIVDVAILVRQLLPRVRELSLMCLLRLCLLRMWVLLLLCV